MSTHPAGRLSVIRLAVVFTAFAGATPRCPGNDVFEQGPIDFDVLLEVPRIDELVTTLPLRQTEGSVQIEAELRFDRRGRVVCGGDCSVDGVAVTARGAVKRRNGRWRYKIVFKSLAEPRTTVKVRGYHSDPRANFVYVGPKGKEKIKGAPVVISPPLGPVAARITLHLDLTGSNKLSGTGEFSAGYGNDDERLGRLAGRIIGDYLTWTLEAGRKKLAFQGFSTGDGSWSGRLRIVVPPEKRIALDFAFPRTITIAPNAKRELEKQQPFVLRFTFPLVDRRTGKPIGPDGNGFAPPTGGDFRILEDGVLIDPLETNQFLSSVTDRPLEVVLLLDYSGSMVGRIDAMTQAASAFIRSQSENARLAVMGFWERQGGFGLLHDFARCTPEAKDSLVAALDDAPQERGASEIWDAIDRALDALGPARDGIVRAVVFLSDGHDTSSRLTVDEIARKARDNAVNLHPLGFNVRADTFPEDRKDLERIAAITGGASFFADEEGDATQALQQLFDIVADKLVREWVLTYVTLKTSGRHVVAVRSEYPPADLELSHVFEVDEDLIGNIRRGVLSIVADSAGASSSSRSYTLLAKYVPRGIDRFRFHLESDGGTIVPEILAEDGLVNAADGWVLAAEGDGWWTVVNERQDELKYGSFGTLLAVTVEGGHLTRICVDNDVYDRGGVFEQARFFVFPGTDAGEERVEDSPCAAPAGP